MCSFFVFLRLYPLELAFVVPGLCWWLLLSLPKSVNLTVYCEDGTALWKFIADLVPYFYPKDLKVFLPDLAVLLNMVSC